MTTRTADKHGDAKSGRPDEDCDPAQCIVICPLGRGTAPAHIPAPTSPHDVLGSAMLHCQHASGVTRLAPGAAHARQRSGGERRM